EWARQHNSQFKVAKFGLMHFSHARTDPSVIHRTKPAPCPNLELNGMTIKPKVSHKFLGVQLNQELQ
ncbi:hypothetical protein NEOLEDRAFT_1080082, partial [Neolentinus lepideus HHB14362 ss-1]